MSDEPRDPSLAVHRFSDRLAGRPPDDVLRADLTPNLFTNLLAWLDRYKMGYPSTRTILTRAVDRLEINAARFDELDPFELLDLVNEMLLLSRVESLNGSREIDFVRDRVGDLKQILDDARSLYTIEPLVDDRGSHIQLGVRVDSATRDAVGAASSPPDTASAALLRAWSALHALHPDIDGAYRDAVKAIECALGPVLTPKDSSPQLGKLKSALWQGSWTFSLDRTGPQGKQPTIDASQSSDVTFLVDLVERVYGTQARHGEAQERPQTFAEASAAVYAAVAIVGWTRAENIKPKP